MPKTKEQYRKELLANIKKIQKVCPDFNMTEEQIEDMLSDKRMALHQRAQTEFTSVELQKTKTQDEVLKYVPTTNFPSSFARNYFHVVKTDGSPESEEFNRKMFTNLLRDDKLGETARENYFLHCLNVAGKLDQSKFGSDVPETEYVEYALDHDDDAGITWETNNFALSMKELKIKQKSQERFEEMRLAGEAFGGAMKGMHGYCRSGAFLTFPLRYLSDENMEKLTRETGFIEYFSIMQSEQSRRSFQKELSQKKNIKIEPFTMDDLEYVVPEHQRTKGGFEARKEIVLEAINKILETTDDLRIPELSEMKENCLELKEAFESADYIPTKEQVQNIAQKSHTLDMTAFVIHRKYSAGNNGDLTQAADALTMLSGEASYFKNEKTMNTLLFYRKEDLEKAEPDQDKVLENKMTQLNEMMAPFRVENKYGQAQPLSQQDIFDFREKMTEIISAAEDTLESSQDQVKLAQAKHVRNQMQRSLIAMGSAFPGMSLDDALSMQGMTIDLTGLKVNKTGNMMSSRQKISITGPDGSVVSGYFTEKSTLKTDQKKVEMERKYTRANPGDKELIHELIEFEFSEPIRAQREAKTEEILNRYKEKDHARIQSLYESIKDETLSFKQSQVSYQYSLGDSTMADVEIRNIAMSDVAELFGTPDLLAKSVPMSVVSDNIKTHGCFMANAKGHDLYHPDKNSPFMTIQEGYADHSPVLKQLADLQVIDFICGNIDRHEGNMMYQFDENNKIVGIMGIDNDYSFFTMASADQNYQHFVHPKDMNYISKSMADKINTMNPEVFQFTLSQRGLKKEAVDAALTRLDEMKQAIADGEPKVLADEEFANHTLNEIKGDKRNIFEIVESGIRNKALNMNQVHRERIMSQQDGPANRQEPAKAFAGTTAALVQRDQRELSSLLQKVSDAQKGVHFGSDKYDKIEKTLMTIDRFIENSQEKHVFSIAEVTQYNNAYKYLKKCCNDYLQRKRDQGEINATGKTGRRISAAQDVLKFCDNKIKLLDKTLTPKNQLLEVKEESDRIQIESFKENPKIAGDLMKNLVELSRKCNTRLSTLTGNKTPETEKQRTGSLKTLADIGNELTVVSRFMQETKIKPEEMGVTKADIENAMKAAKQGREANAKLAAKEKEQTAEKGLESQKKQIQLV